MLSLIFSPCMKMVSVYDFRNKLADYLALVAKTDRPMVVGRFGKPLVMVTPIDKSSVSFDSYFGFLEGNESGEAFVRRVRRSKREARALKARRERSS